MLTSEIAVDEARPVTQGGLFRYKGIPETPHKRKKV